MRKDFINIENNPNEFIIWSNKEFVAFLTPFPNTPGVTVLAPKENWGDDIFELELDKYARFLKAVREVGKILKQALDAPRVAIVFEGTGIKHVHAKLYPMHGKLAGMSGVWGDKQEFIEEYRGYLTTLEGPRMSTQKLKKIAEKIKRQKLFSDNLK